MSSCIAPQRYELLSNTVSNGSIYLTLSSFEQVDIPGNALRIHALAMAVANGSVDLLCSQVGCHIKRGRLQ